MRAILMAALLLFSLSPLSHGANIQRFKFSNFCSQLSKALKIPFSSKLSTSQARQPGVYGTFWGAYLVLRLNRTAVKGDMDASFIQNLDKIASIAKKNEVYLIVVEVPDYLPSSVALKIRQAFVSAGFKPENIVVAFCGKGAFIKIKFYPHGVVKSRFCG